jgi:V/A-type H+-transporting ATPase subunit F
MAMRVLVIADHATCLAFSLAGIATRSVNGQKEALAALDSAMQNREIGLLLITERIAALIRSRVDDLLYTQHQPLVVEIPDTEGPLPGRLSAREMIASLMGH